MKRYRNVQEARDAVESGRDPYWLLDGFAKHLSAKTKNPLKKFRIWWVYRVRGRRAIQKRNL